MTTTQEGGRWEITQYEASYPALTRFLPALQVANGGRCDNTSSMGVIAREYLFCSREGGAWDGTKYVCICGDFRKDRISNPDEAGDRRMRIFFLSDLIFFA